MMVLQVYSMYIYIDSNALVIHSFQYGFLLISSYSENLMHIFKRIFQKDLLMYINETKILSLLISILIEIFLFIYGITKTMNKDDR